MKHEVKKITKIVDEIMTYFLYNHEVQMTDVHVEHINKAFEITFIFHDLQLDELEIRDLKKNLGRKRNPELEDYYWQLTGEAEESNELSLVAMMTDAVEFLNEDNKVRVMLLRKLD